MKNYIYFMKDADYPEDIYARPDTRYPEYPFPKFGLSNESNAVYEMIRNTFIELKLDKDNLGTSSWNPLGDYIKKGDTVLLKPNLVKHENRAVPGKSGIACMTTHPSVIRCILDYVLIALENSGKIIIADAPVQGCDFEKLMEYGGYRKIEEFYQKAGLEIRFEDLREHISIQEEENLHGIDREPAYSGIEINLGVESYYYEKNKDEKRLRITNYDYHELYKHHHGNVHEYLISEAALSADVIINLPKPKSHRKAGYTGALKNLVGVNTSKEYLPHHTKGSFLGKKGDEFYSKDLFSIIQSQYRDWNDVLQVRGHKYCSAVCYFFYRIARKILQKSSQEKYSEGSWWGNNTVWRMVLDINVLLKYADKNGKICKEPQRKILCIGDMIVAGEKEGPMEPSPKKVEAILFTDNAVLFDLILMKIMGFQIEKLPVIKCAIADKRLFEAELDNQLKICSNKESYHMSYIDIQESFHFIPADGWKGAIESCEKL